MPPPPLPPSLPPLLPLSLFPGVLSLALILVMEYRQAL